MTVPKKSLVLTAVFVILVVFFAFSLISLSWIIIIVIRTKLRKCLKDIPNCCKLHIVFKSQSKLGNAFSFKDHIPKEITSGVVYKFQCGLCNESYYSECVRHLDVRIGDHTGISPWPKKDVEPKGTAFSDHLLLCNNHHF